MSRLIRRILPAPAPAPTTATDVTPANVTRDFLLWLLRRLLGSPVSRHDPDGSWQCVNPDCTSDTLHALPEVAGERNRARCFACNDNLYDACDLIGAVHGVSAYPAQQLLLIAYAAEYTAQGGIVLPPAAGIRAASVVPTCPGLHEPCGNPLEDDEPLCDGCETQWQFRAHPIQLVEREHPPRPPFKVLELPHGKSQLLIDIQQYTALGPDGQDHGIRLDPDERIERASVVQNLAYTAPADRWQCPDTAVSRVIDECGWFRCWIGHSVSTDALRVDVMPCGRLLRLTVDSTREHIGFVVGRLEVWTDRRHLECDMPIEVAPFNNVPVETP